MMKHLCVRWGGTTDEASVCAGGGGWARVIRHLCMCVWGGETKHLGVCMLGGETLLCGCVPHRNGITSDYPKKMSI